jgi:hypothetical protein
MPSSCKIQSSDWRFEIFLDFLELKNHGTKETKAEGSLTRTFSHTTLCWQPVERDGLGKESYIMQIWKGSKKCKSDEIRFHFYDHRAYEFFNTGFGVKPKNKRYDLASESDLSVAGIERLVFGDSKGREIVKEAPPALYRAKPGSGSPTQPKRRNPPASKGTRATASKKCRERASSSSASSLAGNPSKSPERDIENLCFPDSPTLDTLDLSEIPGTDHTFDKKAKKIGGIVAGLLIAIRDLFKI